jgi:uncharacterized protein YyaL (SSP411 family)
MSNRLKEASSPYLQQHADNPVDWQEWGPEAFAAAARRQVPVFLSVGYAACHWCHVMAHESFEDLATAEQINRDFVAIKVDREERPDIDSVYMLATQALTGQGGWPMSCFLTPEGEPFYCGTYFPPSPRHGLPSFRQILSALSDAWRDRRDEVTAAAREITARVAGAGAAEVDHTSLRVEVEGTDDEVLSRAVRTLAAQYDAAAGGFGGAPKFPPSTVLEFLLRHHARTGDGTALALATGTLEAMARGGIYDQVGGGFARYAVDRFWVVPHFEKMLYDNALLLRVYLHWWQATGTPLARRVVVETAQFLINDLRTPEGGFASALDADTPVDGHGVEGATYVWTPAQLVEALGADDGEWAAQTFAVTSVGTFEHGASTLQLQSDPPDGDRFQRVRAALAAARAERPQPACDDKIVAAWNGLAITALAEAGAALGESEWINAAVGAADLLVARHLFPEGLRRVSRDGETGSAAGVLEDYASVAEAFLMIFSVTGETAWFDLAGSLLADILARFRDPDGRLFDTASDAESLVVRPRDIADGPTPAGPSAAASALLAYAAYTGSGEHREAAEVAVQAALVVAARAPRAAGWGLAVAEAFAAGPVEVALVGVNGDPALERLRRVVLASRSPGLALAVGPGGSAESIIPLLAGRPAIDGQATAYVCRGFVCDAPTTDPTVLERLLSGG